MGKCGCSLCREGEFLTRNTDRALGIKAMDAVCAALWLTPAPSLLWHSAVPRDGHLLARQAGAGGVAAPSVRLGGTWVPAGRGGLSMVPPAKHAAGTVGSGKQRAPCLGDVLAVIWREDPDAFALNCLN